MNQNTEDTHTFEVGCDCDDCAARIDGIDPALVEAERQCSDCGAMVQAIYDGRCSDCQPLHDADPGVTLVEDEDHPAMCPSCGSEDVATWANDGQSDTADYAECAECGWDAANPEMGFVDAEGAAEMAEQIAGGVPTYVVWAEAKRVINSLMVDADTVATQFSVRPASADSEFSLLNTGEPCFEIDSVSYDTDGNEHDATTFIGASGKVYGIRADGVMS